MTLTERIERLTELVVHAPYPPAPGGPPEGTEVTLTLFREPGRKPETVVGWFACRFVDDDPDRGRGTTDRILGSDGQCWEGRRVRPGLWTR